MQKLQALWITESKRPGDPLPSWRPTMVGMTITGTSAKCSAKCAAERIAAAPGWSVPAKRSRAAIMKSPTTSRYSRANSCFVSGSRTTIQRLLDWLPPVGACSAMSMQSRMICSSTGRSRSSRSRTALVVVSAKSTAALSMFMPRSLAVDRIAPRERSLCFSLSGVVAILAPAKLTVSLRITGVRDDGYHLIDAEMVSLDLYDTVELSDGDSLEIVGPHGAQGLRSEQENLVRRALELCGRSAQVRLHKQIPAGAGLGGGSSDAAAVLRWAGYTDLKSAAGIGADVAFVFMEDVPESPV